MLNWVYCVLAFTDSKTSTKFRKQLNHRHWQVMRITALYLSSCRSDVTKTRNRERENEKCEQNLTWTLAVSLTLLDITHSLSFFLFFFFGIFIFSHSLCSFPLPVPRFSVDKWHSCRSQKKWLQTSVWTINTKRLTIYIFKSSVRFHTSSF